MDKHDEDFDRRDRRWSIIIHAGFFWTLAVLAVLLVGAVCGWL